MWLVLDTTYWIFKINAVSYTIVSQYQSRIIRDDRNAMNIIFRVCVWDIQYWEPTEEPIETIAQVFSIHWVFIVNFVWHDFSIGYADTYVLTIRLFNSSLSLPLGLLSRTQSDETIHFADKNVLLNDIDVSRRSSCKILLLHSIVKFSWFMSFGDVVNYK